MYYIIRSLRSGNSIYYVYAVTEKSIGKLLLLKTQIVNILSLYIYILNNIIIFIVFFYLKKCIIFVYNRPLKYIMIITRRPQQTHQKQKL